MPQAVHSKMLSTQHPGKVHFHRNCAAVILRLKLNSCKGVFKNLFYDFAATFAEVWLKPLGKCFYFYKNAFLLNKQLGYN